MKKFISIPTKQKHFSKIQKKQQNNQNPFLKISKHNYMIILGFMVYQTFSCTIDITTSSNLQ